MAVRRDRYTACRRAPRSRQSFAFLEGLFGGFTMHPNVQREGMKVIAHGPGPKLGVAAFADWRRARGCTLVCTTLSRRFVIAELCLDRRRT